MKKFGFGCMRLPMKSGAISADGEVDLSRFEQMIDRFIAEGFTYFDTAHGYISGKSEAAIREALVKRHPRDTFILADKLTKDYFRTETDIRPFFENQLRWCGVDYFDYYLLHAMTAKYYEKFTRCNAFEICKQLKTEGRIKHFGMSFHDSAALLERILTEHPEIECVQIQFNYADFDDSVIQSGKLLEVCEKFGKPVIVMEPCKGGSLVNLPDEAKKVLDGLNGGSYASYAIRYAASPENVFMVLSGVSNLEQMEDNISYMRNFQPLTDMERTALSQVNAVLKKQDTIACTACRYCVEGCPKQIPIPDLFACYNQKKGLGDWNSNFYYSVATNGRGKASDCIECGMCEKTCPQHLPVRQYMKEIAAAYECDKKAK